MIEQRIGMYLQKDRSWYQRDVSGIKVFSIHHSASLALQKTNDEILQELMDDHTKQGWPGLSYHFVITPDGHTYQINNYTDVTWVDSINWDCIGICLVGYFHEPYNQKPTNNQLLSLKALLDDLSTDHPEFPASQADTYGHRERFATACPGDLFFPYVLEYRSKLGDVDWTHEGDGAVALPQIQQPAAQAQANEAATPAMPQVPIDPPKYTQSQYDETTRELAEAQTMLQEQIQKYTELQKLYSPFAALGYNTIDDIKKVVDQKNADNRGLLAQIVSVKKQLEENHKEDYTALDMGTKAIDELEDLKRDWDSMLKALCPKNPDITAVLVRIDSLLHISEVGAKIINTHNSTQSDTSDGVDTHIREQLKNWAQQLAGYLTIIVWCVIYTAFFTFGGGR